MLRCVLYVFMLFFSLLGVFFLLCMIMNGLLCRKNKDGICTVVYYDGNNESLYDKVYTAYFQSDFFSFCNKRMIAVIGNDIPDFAKKQCRDIIAPCGKICFLKKEEIYLLTAQNICSGD